MGRALERHARWCISQFSEGDCGALRLLKTFQRIHRSQLSSQQHYCCVVAKSCLTLVTPWPVAHQAPLSMGFSRQEYWSRLSFPSPEDFADTGIKPMSPAWQTDSFPPDHLGSPFATILRYWFTLSLCSY